jgi:uncharacterized RDD family membrane protein YckC
MGTLQPATFGQRLISRLIDWVIVYLLCLLFGQILSDGIYGGIQNPTQAIFLPIAYLLYYPILEKNGGTLGENGRYSNNKR